MKHYPLNIFGSGDDEGFVAEVPDLPGCSAWGETEARAASAAQRAIVAWIEAAKAARREIPRPSVAEPVDQFSGKFLVRMPKTLHARLSREARQQGVSLNQYAVFKLAR